MTIHLDTSALVGALAGPRDAFSRLRGLVAQGHRLWTLDPDDFRDVPGLKLA